MAIRIPDFNTEMSMRVPDANLAKVGSAEGEFLQSSGAAISKMGAEIRDRALAQARSAQILKAKEAYALKMTDMASQAEYNVDQFTGKVGKEANAKLFSDYIADNADKIKAEVKKEFVDSEWHPDFEEQISPSQISSKTNAIIKQASYTSNGAKEAYNTVKNTETLNLTGFNEQVQSGIAEASKSSEKLQAQIYTSLLNGNIAKASENAYMEDAKYSIGKIAKENVELTGRYDDLFSLIGTDFAIPEEYRKKLEAEMASDPNSKFVGMMKEFEVQRAIAKEGILKKNGNYDQVYQKAQQNLLLKPEDKLDLIENFFKNKASNLNNARKSVDDQIPNIVAEISDTVSPNRGGRVEGAVKQGVAQGKKMLENGAEKTDVYDSMAKMYASKQITDITTKFAMQPSVYRRSQMRTIEEDVKKQVLKDFPELALSFKTNPTMGSRIGELARGMMDDADNRLAAEFAKNKEAMTGFAQAIRMLKADFASKEDTKG